MEIDHEASELVGFDVTLVVCGCMNCGICGALCHEDSLTIDECGEPVGIACCGHLLDEDGVRLDIYG